MMTSRTLSTPVCVAASISRTSRSRPCAISTQASHSPHGSARRAVHAVQRPRQDARRRGLADAARAGKDERLRQPAAGERVAERRRDVLLPDHILEALRAPLAGEHLIRHWRLGKSLLTKTCRPRAPPRPGAPAAQVRVYLALLPSGPDAVRRLILHRVRAAVRRAGGNRSSVPATWVTASNLANPGNLARANPGNPGNCSYSRLARVTAGCPRLM